MVCASPEYLTKRGRPRTIADLDKHSCLMLRYPGSQQAKWPLRKDRKFTPIAVHGHMDADESEVLTVWALAGQGLVMKPLFEVGDPIPSGALEVVLEAHPPQPATVAILHAYQRMEPPKLRALSDMIVDAASAHIEAQLALLAPARARSRRSG